MRKRVATKKSDGPKVRIVPVDGAAPLVTFDDPKEPTEPARLAFVRLRPPADLPPAETRAWADSVRAVARAVRVLPTPKSALVPRQTAVDAEGTDEQRRDIRDECMTLARKSGDPELEALCEKLLSEAERV